MYFLFFFFSSRRRHTRFKCDWSSDVCSSDLVRQEEHTYNYHRDTCRIEEGAPDSPEHRPLPSKDRQEMVHPHPGREHAHAVVARPGRPAAQGEFSQDDDRDGREDEERDQTAPEVPRAPG